MPVRDSWDAKGMASAWIEVVENETRTVVRLRRVEGYASGKTTHEDSRRSQKVMERGWCRLCWTRRRVCRGGEEVRGEREGERKRGKMGEGSIFTEGGRRGEGETRTEREDIWADFSAEDQLYWRRPTGRRPDGASRDGSGSRRRDGLLPGRGCICKSK